MRLTLSRRGDYSVRAMIDVAGAREGSRRKARQIAAAMDIPQKFVSQILANLVREGLLSAHAGPDGGYALARPAEDISLLDVVVAAEGPVVLDNCVLRGGSCDWTNECPVHEVWAKAQAALVEVLGESRISDLSGVDAAILSGTYSNDDEPAHRLHTPRKGESRRAPS